MPPTHDKSGRLDPALPDDPLVLPLADCAATLAHLIVCAAGANPVRFQATPGRVIATAGAVAFEVGLDTARALHQLLADEPGGGRTLAVGRDWLVRVINQSVLLQAQAEAAHREARP